MKDEDIAVAIACHDSAAVLGRCLAALGDHRFRLIVFDDGSRDATGDIARAAGATVLRGDGAAWWTGATRAALEYGFDQLGCRYGLLLNPDVCVDAAGVRRLAAYVEQTPRTIAGALVVDARDATKVAWAGVRFRELWPAPPVEAMRYVARQGACATDLGTAPYPTDELHGRAVLISGDAYREIGRLDAETFPHYGGDSEFSFRARAKGFALMILPEVKCRLDIDESGMRVAGGRLSPRRIENTLEFLLERRRGEALRVIPALYFRHLPWWRAATATAYSLGASVVRRLTMRSWS